MRIAYLILCHQDPHHILRLVKRINEYADVYIHVDARSKIDDYKKINECKNVHFTNKRFHAKWGGWNAVLAEIELMQCALNSHNNYDRFILLQGADYPIKTDDEIVDFFDRHVNIEFVRACNVSISSDPYFYGKCRYYLYPNAPKAIGVICERITKKFDIKLRDGYIYLMGRKVPVFYGCAQWAITRSCAEHIIRVYTNDHKFNRWFYHAACPDELYFHTIIMNSSFSEKTTKNGPEEEKRGLVNWRNLHYFEYPQKVKWLDEEDFDTILSCDSLYIRKVSSSKSSRLLDMIDEKLCDRNCDMTREVK